ncbi:MAG TPA: fructose-bisphosphatase class III [Byssovorax sp.]
MADTSNELLRALRYRFRSAEAALAEVAHLRAVLELPRGTVHVMSDVHGEFAKLEHILRNGSGTLRALADATLGDRLSPDARAGLLNLVYYPREAFARATASLADADARMAFVRESLAHELVLLRALATRGSYRRAERLFPEPYTEVFTELVTASALGREPAYLDALVAPFVEHDGGLELLRAAAHAIRSFAMFELVVAGDLGDRGPRVDRVIDAIRRQRRVSITWGNHDAEWMGACLGQEALVATVLRISLRYGRVAQLEEGYGIPVEPLELLAREAYDGDPAERFKSKGEDLRDPLLLARMQKAIAILQFKLEGQTTRRNPSFDLEHRNLLHRIDPSAGTVTVDGKTYPLLDTRFPTIDWADPYRLSDAEARCIARMRAAFLDSPSLWQDMRFVESRGSMLLTRDENVIFHGCVPCDAKGEWLELEVDGAPRKGKALFDACERVVRRAFRGREQEDVDLLYYLWAGPRSPCFGKDRMATFETYFLAEKATYKETKNPYFQLIHDVAFCEKVGAELGVRDPSRVLIVNGHVPVKLEEGESPLKKSGLAVTIDGAFSEAYGDHGFTLVIDADRTYLAKHHHFGSVADAIDKGADIVPEISELRAHLPPWKVGGSARGDDVRAEIAALELLAGAYRRREIEPPEG